MHIHWFAWHGWDGFCFALVSSEKSIKWRCMVRCKSRFKWHVVQFPQWFHRLKKIIFFSLHILVSDLDCCVCRFFVHIFFHNWLHFNWLKCGFTYAIWQIKINSPTRLNKAEQNKSSRYFAHHKLPTRDKRGALCLSLSSMQSLEILSIPFSPLIKRRVSVRSAVTFNLPYYSNNFTLACGSTAKAQTIVKRKEEKKYRERIKI